MVVASIFKMNINFLEISILVTIWSVFQSSQIVAKLNLEQLILTPITGKHIIDMLE